MYLKINPKIFLVVLLVLLTIFLLMGFYCADAGYFYNSLTPELTGVAVELVIIILVFNYWQESSKKKKLIEIERRLREYLIFFLRHNFSAIPQNLKIGRFYGEDHDQNQRALEQLRLYIQGSGIECRDVEAIKKYCEREVTTIEVLLSVASGLTNEHFKAWSRIVYFLKNITMSSDTFEKDVMDVIQNIKRFDNASYKNGLYVGSKDL